MTAQAAVVIGTPAFRADAATAPGVRSTLTITKPTGTADGDLLVAAIAVQTTDTVTEPAGWTLARAVTLYNASGSRLHTYWRVASGEGASWDWTIGASVTCTGWVGAFTGCKATDIASQIVTSSNPNQAGVTNAVATGVTTTGINTLLVGVWVCSGGRSYTPPGDMTEEHDGGGGPSLEIAWKSQAAAGASGNKTAVISSAAAAGAQLLAFRASGT